MTSQSRLIRMLMWHHGGVIRGTWHVLAACWRALGACWHIQACGEHMKTREKEGRHSAGTWKRVKRKVIIPTRLGRLSNFLSNGRARCLIGWLEEGLWDSNGSGCTWIGRSSLWWRVERKVFFLTNRGRAWQLWWWRFRRGSIDKATFYTVVVFVSRLWRLRKKFGGYAICKRKSRIPTDGANCWCLEFASSRKWPEFASSYQQLHSQPRTDVAGKSVDCS